MMELVIIAAVAENNVIGVDGKLPWSIPEDLKRFRKLTLNHPVIMGRKTYESIGKHLPRRLNIVLSGQDNFKPEGVYVAGSLEEAIIKVENEEPFLESINYNKCYVIGGQEVYRQALPLVDKLEITHIHRAVEGDTYFPEIDFREWHVKEKINKGDYSFVSYVKNGKR